MQKAVVMHMQRYSVSRRSWYFFENHYCFSFLKESDTRIPSCAAPAPAAVGGGVVVVVVVVVVITIIIITIKYSTSFKDCYLLCTECQPMGFGVNTTGTGLNIYTWRFGRSSLGIRGRIVSTAAFSLSALLFLLLAKPSGSIHNHHHDHLGR